MSSGAKWWVLGWLLLGVGASRPAVLAQVEESPAAVELVEVGSPHLDQFEEPVQQQLQTAREDLAGLVEDPSTDRSQLFSAFLGMGQLYLAYDLPEVAKSCFLNASRLQSEDFRAYYYLGVLELFDGNFGAAADNLVTALELKGPDLATLLRLGEAQLSLGMLDEAEDSFRSALALDQDSAAAVDGLGRVAAGRGDAAAAIGLFEHALELQPEADSIHHRLGMAYRETGDLDAARQHLAQNRGTRVRFPDPLMQDLATLVRSSQQYFNAGIDALRAGDYEGAVHWLELALAATPDDYLVPYNLAIAQLELGHRAEAIEWLRQSIEVNPDFRNGHFNLGSLLAQDGKIEEAARHFQRAHEIDPDDHIAHLEWATALSHLGQNERAMVELEDLVVRDPTNSQALIYLAALQADADRLTEAEETLAKILVVSADPQAQAEAHLQLAALAGRQGRSDLAQEHLEAALSLAPDSEEVLLALARSYGQAQRYTEAADEFGAVVSLDPGNLEAQFGRAMALLMAEDYPQALASLERALEQVPGEPSLTHALARLLATCPDASIRDGERAFELAQALFDESPTMDRAETVAMALAEMGKYEDAAIWQKSVVDGLEWNKREAQAALARRRLELYTSGQPVRAPWLEP